MCMLIALWRPTTFCSRWTTIYFLSKLFDRICLMRLLQVDKDIVKGIIDPARKKFSQQFGDEAPTVQFDSENFLPPPPGVFVLQDCFCSRRRATGSLSCCRLNAAPDLTFVPGRWR